MTKLLYTGSSGFLGRNTLPQLAEQYDVTTLGPTERDMLRCDLSCETPTLPCRYDIVLHAAGKAHVVPKTKEEEQSFFDINFGGTERLCRALEQSGLPRALIFISTVAVYGTERGENLDESQPLLGGTPYAESKIQAERFLIDWCSRHQVTLTILRPSLLAGFDAPGNLGSMVNGIRRGYYVNINHGACRRSVFMASDIARLVPLVADKGGIYNVADSRQPSFGELSELIARQLGKRPPLSIPLWLAKALARIGDLFGENSPFCTTKLLKMTESLTFSNRLLCDTFRFTPTDVLNNYQIKMVNDQINGKW